MEHLQVQERLHNNEKSFSCLKCDQSFANKSNLKTHRRVHTKERPFNCSKCDKLFSRKHHLKIHEKIHLDEANKKLSSCSDCGKTFRDPQALEKHVRSVHAGKNLSAAQNATTMLQFPQI